MALKKHEPYCLMLDPEEPEVRCTCKCPECGEPGKHWIVGLSLRDILDGTELGGFWTCSKFYGPDGRRLNP